MAKQTINIGASANDGTGTPLRTAFDYCNLNFTELYTAVGPSGNNIVVPGTATITGAATVGTTLGVTGVSTFAAGTALLPGITTTGDTNTGIFNPSADTWAVSTGGTERFRVNSTGLGVGVVPSYNLDVQGADNSIIAQFGGVGGRKVNFTTSANGAFANGFFNFVSTSSVGAFSFQNTTGTLLHIDAGCQVGIGISTFGNSASKVLAIGTGTEPTTGPAGSVQFFTSTRSASNTIPAFFCEGSGVTNAAITNTTVTNKIAIKVNGTIYYLLATTSAA